MANFKVLLVILLLDAVTVTHQSSIIGGKDVTINDFNWMGALVLKSSPNDIVCGATLINKRWMVTAAHCFSRPKEAYKVRMAVMRIHDRTEDRDVYTIIKLIPHPNFKMRNLGDDIAMVKLDRNVLTHNRVQPIFSRAKSIDNFYSNTACYVAGWGRTAEYENLDKYKPMQEVQVPLVSRAKCRQTYRNFMFNLGPGMFCAGTRGKDACFGDSGGSLVCHNGQWVMVGVMSLGQHCGLTGIPSIYTSVASYESFINNTIAAN